MCQIHRIKQMVNEEKCRKVFSAFLLFFGVTSFLFYHNSISTMAYTVPDEYTVPESTKQLIVVRYKGNSKGKLTFYKKNSKGKWVKKFSCTAWLGKNGIGKKKEGDGKTPKGLYSLGQAFGIKKNPGTKMPYVKVTKQHYWCTDSGSKYYNQLIRKDKTGHSCSGEHLIEYKGVYDYGIFIGYNAEGASGKGSAIFLHCSQGKATAGCVAISQKYMKKVLKRLNPDYNPMILIY